MTHGHAQEAQRVIEGIEHQFEKLPPAHDLPRVRLRPRKHTPLWEVAQTLFKRHRQRTYVGLALMVAQAFFYNAIFFTYALILTDFYGVPSGPCRLLPVALCGRQLPRTGADRPPVRHAGPPADDRLHLYRLGSSARGHRLPVRARPDRRRRHRRCAG